ncbi:unnamed protein product, partial [Didymodactylos carnosus]
ATAYFGLRMSEPKVGEIRVVNGAAGAMGSFVGQLAKAKDLTKISLEDALKESAPDGVDVGTDFRHEMISKYIRIRGRTCICGSISNYNYKEPKTCRNRYTDT